MVVAAAEKVEAVAANHLVAAMADHRVRSAVATVVRPARSAAILHGHLAEAIAVPRDRSHVAIVDRHDRSVVKAARREPLAVAIAVHRNRLTVSPKVGRMKHGDRVVRVVHNSAVRIAATKAVARQ